MNPKTRLHRLSLRLLKNAHIGADPTREDVALMTAQAAAKLNPAPNTEDQQAVIETILSGVTANLAKGI